MATLTSLTNAAFSDRDLCFALREAADDDGWATAADIANEIKLDHPRPRQCVGSRLSWLYRYGVMERGVYKSNTVWKLNPKGEQLMYGERISPAAHQLLGGLAEGERLEVTDVLAKHLSHSSRGAIHLTRRAWSHRMGGWRDPKLQPREVSNGD